MAWQIVKHAFTMIFNNFGQALRVSLVPSILLIAAWAILMTIAGVPMDYLDPSYNGMAGTEFGVMPFLLILVALAFTMFVAGWIAVSWHRFILREEYSGFVPATSGRPIWGYVGKSLLLGLLVGLAAIPVFFIVGVLFSGALVGSGATSPVAVLLMGLLVGTVMGFLWFRMAICLPARALGEHMTFGEAWSTTAPLSGTIFGVTAIIVALNIGVSAILTILASGIPLLSAVFEIAVNWLSTMVGISVLTTLYGHLVEGRPLVD